MTSAIDESAGSWHRRVWALAWPIILSNLSVPLLGAVDTAVMGHLPEETYLGGVAIGAQIFSVVFWAFGFLRMSTTGFAAQARGAGDADEVRAVLARAVLLAGGIGIGLIVLQWPLGLLSFSLFPASAAVESLAADYFYVRVWAAPATLAHYAFLGWFIGMHNTRAALVLQLWMNGVNIALDLVFVLLLGWGIEGVALATVIAEYSAIAVAVLVARPMLARAGGQWVRARIIEAARLKAMMAVNRDIFIRTLALTASFAWFTARGSALGDLTLAANAVLMNFSTFLAYGLDGFAHAAEPMVGSAYGSRKPDALRQAVRASTHLAAAVALVYVAVYGLGGTAIIALLTGLADVRAAAAAYLPWVIVLPLVAVWCFQLDGVFIGATRGQDMRNTTILAALLYFVATLVLVPLWGNHGLWASLLVFMAARGLLLFRLYPRLVRQAGR